MQFIHFIRVCFKEYFRVSNMFQISKKSEILTTKINFRYKNDQKLIIIRLETKDILYLFICNNNNNEDNSTSIALKKSKHEKHRIVKFF